MVMMRAQIPGPSSQTEIRSLEVMLVSNVITEDHLPQHAIVNMLPPATTAHTITTKWSFIVLFLRGEQTKILFLSVDPLRSSPPHTHNSLSDQAMVF